MAGAIRLQVVFVAAVCTLWCFVPAAAEESFGEEYIDWELTSFSLTGAPDELESTLTEGLALSGRRRILRTTHPPFKPELLRADLQRTKLFLARKGYPQAQIRVEFEPNQRNRSLQITLQVTTGERVVVDGFELRGIRADLLAKHKRFPVNPGDPFDQDVIEAAKVEITRRVREYGYAHATTKLEAEIRQPGHVHLIFQVDQGDIQYFGNTQVDGIPSDLEKVARRSIQVEQGALYSPHAMEQSEENLRFLGLFRRVKLQLKPVAVDTLDLHLDLSERSHKRLQTGIGYFTDDQLRLRVEWSHNNLFREGRGLGILLRGTRFEQRFSVSVWKPALIVPRTRGTISTSIARQDEENYEALLTSANAWITQIWSFNTTLRYGVEVSYNDYKTVSDAAVEFEETAGLLTKLVFSWVRETARDRLWPSNGSTQSVRLRWAPDGVSESQFVLVEPDVAFYRKPYRRLILSGRLRLGMGGVIGSVPIPPDERFYAGGASSHRGFERRKLGPKDAANAPLGGAAKLESSVELRFPLFRSLFGATFVDAGQVWRRFEDARGKDIEIASGLGLMFKTPAGPLRIDYAWRLTHQDKFEPRSQFHFSIGNPF